MNEAIKTTLRNALRQYRGDDLERARRAFRDFTPEQMQQEHGQSGRTRPEILAAYEEHAAAVDAAQSWVESQA